MNVDKAISRMQYVIDDRPEIYSEEVYNALKLGIEALKRVKHERAFRIPFWANQLPGETEQL